MTFKYNPHTDELDYFGIAGPSGGSTDNAVARWDGTGGDVLQDSSVFIEDGGNVGIGTATPGGTLDVQTSALAGTPNANYDDLVIRNSASGGITILTGNAMHGGVVFGDSDNTFRGGLFYGHDGNYLRCYVNGGERLRVITSGMGIGTNDPAKTLELNAAAGGSLRLTYNDADGSATDYCDLQVGSDGDLTVTTVDSDGAAGHINLVPDGMVAIGGTTDYTRQLNVLGAIQVRENDDGNQAVLIAGDADEGLVELYHAGARKVRFQGDGNCYLTGNGRNLGIGTYEPDKNLELNDASGGALRLTYNDSTGSATDYCDFQVGSDGDLTVTTVDSDGAEGNIILMPDGNVGINDTTATYPLTIQKSVVLGDLEIIADFKQDNNADGFLMGTTAAVYQGSATAVISSRGTDDHFLFRTIRHGDIFFEPGGSGFDAPVAKHVMLSTGEFGIGLVDPSTALHVEINDGSVITADNINNNATKGIRVTQLSSGDGTGTWLAMEGNNAANKTAIAHIQEGASSTTAGLAFYTESSGTFAERMRILGSGNVGIGTSSPDKTLEINAAAGGSLRLTYNDANGSATDYSDFSVNSDGALLVESTDDITLEPVGDAIVNNADLVFTGTARIGWTKITANGVTLAKGEAAGTTVTDLQTANDTNLYHIDEVNDNPPIDLIVDFTSVTAFNWVQIIAGYKGITSHMVGIQVEITPFDGSAWYNYQCMDHHGTLDFLEDYSFFIPDDSIHINSGVVKVRFLHSGTTGSTQHDMDIDVVALYQ